MTLTGPRVFRSFFVLTSVTCVLHLWWHQICSPKRWKLNLVPWQSQIPLHNDSIQNSMSLCQFVGLAPNSYQNLIIDIIDGWRICSTRFANHYFITILSCIFCSSSHSVSLFFKWISLFSWRKQWVQCTVLYDVGWWTDALSQQYVVAFTAIIDMEWCHPTQLFFGIFIKDLSMFG